VQLTSFGAARCHEGGEYSKVGVPIIQDAERTAAYCADERLGRACFQRLAVC
jgi:hypothetical protein